MEVEVTLRLTVSQSVCLGIEYPCGTHDKILFPFRMLLSEICGLVSMGHPLWREDGPAICGVSIQWSESHRTRNHTLLSHLRLTAYCYIMEDSSLRNRRCENLKSCPDKVAETSIQLRCLMCLVSGKSVQFHPLTSTLYVTVCVCVRSCLPGVTALCLVITCQTQPLAPLIWSRDNERHARSSWLSYTWPSLDSSAQLTFFVLLVSELYFQLGISSKRIYRSISRAFFPPALASAENIDPLHWLNAFVIFLSISSENPEVGGTNQEHKKTANSKWNSCFCHEDFRPYFSCN
jgi:hypothetical protein